VLITEPGTIDTLVADAAGHDRRVTRRLVRDWTENGLLDYPDKRPAGRGQGSRPALYPATQRMLFLTLLHHREGNGIRRLARIPVGIWLYWGEAYVPLSQARRAFMTWLGNPGVSKEHAKATAKTILDQIAHPDATPKARRELLGVLTDIGYTGRFTTEPLEQALRRVFEPGHGQIRRALGHPDAPITTDAFIDLVRARFTATLRLNAGKVSDEDFLQARRAHLIHYADYARRQPLFAASVPQPAAGMYESADLETALNQCCSHLLTTIGLAALYPSTQA
jgi:hypothetical protein